MGYICTRSYGESACGKINTEKERNGVSPVDGAKLASEKVSASLFLSPFSDVYFREKEESVERPSLSQ